MRRQHLDWRSTFIHFGCKHIFTPITASLCCIQIESHVCPWQYLHHFNPTIYCSALPSFALLPMGARSSEAESAVCNSFIRQMSPSQAMNNHAPPPIGLPAPTWSGLQPSCWCSSRCFGTCPLSTKHLFFFMGLVPRCNVSVELYLFSCATFSSLNLFSLSCCFDPVA